MINRFVVYTESDLDSSPRIPGMSLARIYENRIMPHLDSFFEDAGVDPERGEWRVRSGMPDNNTLSGVLQASLFSSDDPARIRLVGHVGTLDPSPNFQRTQKNLLLINVTENITDPVWESGVAPFVGSAQVQSSAVAKIMAELATEIMVANSQSYRPILDNITKSISLDKFLRAKVSFCLRQNFVSPYGRIASDAGYISFCSVHRRGDTQITDGRLGRRVAGIWDDFLLSEFPTMIPRPLEILKAWRPRNVLKGKKASIYERMSPDSLRADPQSFDSY